MRNKARKWQEWEKKFVEENYSRMTSAKLALELKRTERSVDQFIYREMSAGHKKRIPKMAYEPDMEYNKKTARLQEKAKRVHREFIQCRDVDKSIELLREYSALRHKIKSRRQKPKRAVDFTFRLAVASTNQYRRMP